MAHAEAERLRALPEAAERDVQPAAQPVLALDWRIGGVLLGLLVTAAVALQGPLGVSSAYVKADAMVAAGTGGPLAENAYLAASGAAVTPELVIVVGMILGALLASRLWRTRSNELPRRWTERFGAGRLLRFAAAFVGGALLLFGARLAGGCTSGHVISGMSQLALSGMVFAAAVFASGIPVALLVYRRDR